MTVSPTARNGRLTLDELRAAVEVDAVDSSGSTVGFTDGELEALYAQLLAAEKSAAAPARIARHVEPSARVLSFCCTPPLPLVGVSIAMETERQQNDSLADG